MELRRFKYITEEQEKKDKLESLISEKNLSREDLMLILETIGLNIEVVNQLKSSKDLVVELLNRGGELIEAGLYANQEIRVTKKYSTSRESRVLNKIICLDELSGL